MKIVHPDDLLEMHASNPKLASARLATMRAVHDICRQRFNRGERSFTRTELGEELEKAGVLTRASFKQRHCNIYVEMVNAWQIFAAVAEFNIDDTTSVDHPHMVLLQLLSTPQRRVSTTRSLLTIHRACIARFNRGDQNFGAAELGREVPKGRLAANALTHFLPQGVNDLLLAWQRVADKRGVQASELPSDHPDAIFQKYRRAKNLRIDAAENLEAIHAVCRSRFERGEIDFTSVTIGHELLKTGVFSGLGSTAHRLKNFERYSALREAWQAHADAQWIDNSPELSPTHPDAVYRRLKVKARRADKLRVLLCAHRICRDQHVAGSLDFTINAIEKLLVKQGVVAAGTISKSSTADFRTIASAWSRHARPWLEVDGGKPPPVKPRRQKAHDLELDWVRREYPHLEEWRESAAAWLATKGTGLSSRLAMLNNFFNGYLAKPNAPTAPADLLRRGATFPDPLHAVATGTLKGKSVRNNELYDFFNWVLLRDFSVEADDGELVISPAFRNPLQPAAKSKNSSTPSHSVRSPLPFDFIHELRHILAEGEHFRDWKFAQGALGAKPGQKGAPSNDWFVVDPSVIDYDDPDCVWRKRTLKRGKKEVVDFQMWSPVRWVAVLMKLLLPLRTFQIRMLDSGESDSWKYERGNWLLNDHPLAEPQKNIWQQGVLRRNREPAGPNSLPTVLYISTNKTADADESGPNKGYVMPWFEAQDITENVFHWLEKLRIWQSRYNPIRRRTSWTELDGRHMHVKSPEQLATYTDTCFLFRMAEDTDEQRMLPVTDSRVSNAWFNLLFELQVRLAARGETHPGGRPIVLVSREGAGRRYYTSNFPLHCLRVSLITALALEGEVPFPILQKLVGHSRLVMTLYYTKPGASRISGILADAAKKLSENREERMHAFLLDTDHESLVQAAICNSPASLGAVIPIHPSERNAAGWMFMHHGICLVGGNVSEIADNASIGGCHNGGELDARGIFQPVPGGPRNCIRCRWFVTEPHYLPALADHFNNIAYHFDEARNDSLRAYRSLQEAKRLKAQAENEAQQTADLEVHRRAVIQADRIRGKTAKRFSDLVDDLV